MNIMLLSDGYKLSHHKMYPKGTELVFSNLTPRSSKHAPKGAPVNGVIVTGIKKAVYDLDKVFKEFFEKPFDETIKELFDNYLSMDYSVEHFRDLHNLGYLPVEIRAMREGSFCPIGVPFFTIHNTNKRFFWLTNFLETYLSANLWKSTTSATIASGFYVRAKKAFLETTGSTEGMNFHAHNFSARGTDSVDGMVSIDLGHLLFFNGSDTLPTMGVLKELYGVTSYMGNVPASEHSVMSAGTKENELETYSYLIDQFPKGYLSLVSDTWDLWNVITNILPQLKEKILNRDGKLVIRPDSGDPVDILCGNPQGKNINEDKGVVELLWDIFGGTVNKQGYKILNPKIGVIYGDSITRERQINIYNRLEAKGFAVSNIVLGVGLK